MQDPWFYALKKLRQYITPEDIRLALDSGASEVTIKTTVLEAIARKSCEDPSACAFVVVRAFQPGAPKE